MEILAKWLLIASVNMAATVSPGPAFALTIRNAAVYGRKAGIYSAIGLGAGVGVLLCAVLGGFSTLISQSVFLYDLIRYTGAAYLIYIGIKSLMAKKSADAAPDTAQPEEARPVNTLAPLAAFRSGFMTNVLNPKGIVFFTAVYAQFITPGTPLWVMVLYGVTSMAIETLWFSFVTLILTDKRVRTRFMKISGYVEKLCGGILVLLGIGIALEKGLAR